MEKDIDVYEFEWWSTLIGHVMLFIVSIFSIYGWFVLNDMVQSRFSSAKLYVLFCPAIFFVYIFPSLLELFSRPKAIIFKENKIQIIGPLNNTREFIYEDIKQLEIYQKYSYPRFYKGRLHFGSSNTKIIFNPDRLPDFADILKIIHSKGLGFVIEQRD